MKDSTRRWVAYAEENLGSAKVLAEAGYYNPCLQNAQQVVEKAMKALMVEHGMVLRRTHSICELDAIFKECGVDVGLSMDECELLDAIYLPSKYPLGSALPNAVADAADCAECIGIAERTLARVKSLLV